MNTFDSSRARRGRAEARRREQQLKRKLEKLLEIHDEETFKIALERDFEIKSDHLTYQEMLKIWRGAR